MMADFNSFPLRAVSAEALAASPWNMQRVAFTLAPSAAATDIVSIGSSNYDEIIAVNKISVSGICTAGNVPLVVSVIKSNDRSDYPMSGTAYPAKAEFDSAGYPSSVHIAAYTQNPATLTGNRKTAAQRTIVLGSATTAGTVADFVFDQPILLRNMIEWVVINLGGQTIPAGTVLSIDITASSRKSVNVIFAGDSTTSNATTLFQEARGIDGISGRLNIRNCGSNGMRLIDVIDNTNSPPYPLAGIRNYKPAVVPFCYGINDVRQGACDRATLISRVSTALDMLRSQATHMTGPDTKIILWGPNSITTDDYGGAGFVTLTGLFSGMTMAQAAQEMTDILYDAYQAFVGDPRVYAVVQKQDIFGRTAQTVAASGLMTDQLHPNARGQALSMRQIMPVIYRAVSAYKTGCYPY